MFRKALALTAIILVFGSCEVQADIIHSTWVGGESDYWIHPANWDPPIRPYNSASQKFLVTIDSNSIGMEKIEINFSFAERVDVNQVDCYGTVELAGSCTLTLVDANGLTNHGYLEIHDLEINGNVRNTAGDTAGARLELGDVDIGGNLYNQARATIEVGEEVDVYQGDLENAGLIEIAASGEIYANQYFNNVGDILIYGGECGCDEGILNNNSTGVIKGFGVVYVGFGVVYGDLLLRNEGQIIAFGGSLAIGINGALINTGVLGNWPLSSLHIKPSLRTEPAVDVNNNGTIEVNAGGGVVFDCNLVNEPNGIIELRGGTLAAETIVQKAEANFQGQGNITTSNLIIETNGLIRLTGPTNIFGGVQIDPNATLEISDGTTLIKGRTTCNNGTIHMIGGRLIPQGGFTNSNCNITWKEGAYSSVADFNLDGQVNFIDFAYLANAWLSRASWY